MDTGTDSGTVFIQGEGPVLEQELPPSTEGGGTILLELLDFKTHLHEALEELCIRRDAEKRFEDQISRLVLEKQELEWEKESLQQVTKTLAKQHAESLTTLKKQFQVKIRNTEEEMGKYQVIAELKDKEINNLKEELKSLQLLKYNLEKKSSELVREQKLLLQSRTKDSHLNQLGEVEKRFTALLRQCAVVKKAHETLEQNVKEAVNRNQKLMTANEKQEAITVTLNKDLEQVRNKLIKAQMSLVRYEDSPADREEHIQQLHQKLTMETEMNKKLGEENGTLRAEKQKVMNSLQLSQQLLLHQTQTVSRVELELQTQRQHLKRGGSSQTVNASTQTFPTVMEVIRGEESLLAPISSSEPSSSGCKQHSVCIQTKQTDYVGGTAVGATGPTEGQNNDQQINKTLSPANSFINSNIISSLSDTLIQTGNNILNKYKNNFNTKEGDSDLGLKSNLSQTSPLCDDHIIKGRCVSNTSTVSNLSPWSFSAAIDLKSKEKSDIERQGMSESDENGDVEGGNNIRDVERNEQWQQWNREYVEDMKEGGNAAEERATLTAQTTDRADRQEDSQESAEDAGDAKQPETETKDGTEKVGIDEVQKRGKTGSHMPKTQLLDQTSSDTSPERRNTSQVIDSGDTEPSRSAWEPLYCRQSLCQKACVCSPVKTDCEDLCHDDATTVHLHQLHQVIQKNIKERPAEKLVIIPTSSSEALNELYACLLQTKITAVSAEPNSVISVHVLEKTAIQTGPYPNPSDMTTCIRPTAEMCPVHVSEDPLVNTEVDPPNREFSEQPPGQPRYLISDENGEDGSGQDSMINDKEEDGGEAGMTETNIYSDNKNDAAAEIGSPNCSEQPAQKEKLLELQLPSYDTYTINHSSVHSGVLSPRVKSSSSVLHQMAQGFPVPGQTIMGPGGPVGNLSATLAIIQKKQLDKVPSVMSRMQDLPSASCVSGTAASSRRPQQEEWRPMGETWRETATSDTENRPSLTSSTPPVCAATVTVSRLRQSTLECSRAPNVAAAVSSLWDYCSQEGEEQHASVGAQISKIEEFLFTNKLCLSQGRRTDS